MRFFLSLFFCSVFPEYFGFLKWFWMCSKQESKHDNVCFAIQRVNAHYASLVERFFRSYERKKVVLLLCIFYHSLWSSCIHTRITHTKWTQSTQMNRMLFQQRRVNASHETKSGYLPSKFDYPWSCKIICDWRVMEKGASHGGNWTKHHKQKTQTCFRLYLSATLPTVI